MAVGRRLSGLAAAARGAARAVARPPDLQCAPRPKRRLAISRISAVLAELSLRSDPAGRQHAAARRAPGSAIRRTRPPDLQAPGLQSDWIVQGQRHDLRSGAGVTPRQAPRGLRFHREHLGFHRSEEHTSELQSPCNLVCRLLLEKKKKKKKENKDNTDTIRQAQRSA